MKKSLNKCYVLLHENGILSINESFNNNTVIKKDIDRLIKVLTKRYITNTSYITRKSHYLINDTNKRVKQITINTTSFIYEKVKLFLSNGNYCNLNLK
jgi:hypothetical protein